MPATMTKGATVAKKQPGRPKKAGEGKLVRINPELFAKARIIAMRRGSQLGEYIGSLIDAPVNRDYQRVLKELADESKGGAK